MADCIIAVAYIGFVILLLSDFIFAIAGSIVLSMTKDANGETENVWVYVLVQVIFMWLCACGFGSDIHTKTTIDERGHKTVERSSSTNIISLGYVGISIWGLVIYTQASQKTEDYYMDTYPQLWGYFATISIMHLVIYVCSAVILVLACLMGIMR